MNKQAKAIVLATIVWLCLAGWPVSASSGPPAATPVAIEMGQPAPFAGQLIPAELATRLGQKLERLKQLAAQEKEN